MEKLHHLKMQQRQTGLPLPEIAEHTVAVEAARKKFDRAYAAYLALHQTLE